MHVHEFVDEYGDFLEDYVVYLKHTAVREFFFDGGPGARAPLAIKEVWTRIEPLIKEWREYYEHPALFESIEYLGKEALNIYPIEKEVYQ